MLDGTCEVTTDCPHCGGAVVWAVLAVGEADDEPRVSDSACDCELTGDEWADLSAVAETVLGELAVWAA